MRPEGAIAGQRKWDAQWLTPDHRVKVRFDRFVWALEEFQQVFHSDVDRAARSSVRFAINCRASDV